MPTSLTTDYLTLENTAAWTTALVEAGDHDVYHTPAYHSLCAANGDGEPILYVARAGNNTLVHPFIRRAIPSSTGSDVSYFDLETAYGYAGPLASTTDPSFLAQAWLAFGDWCRENRIVAEFVRFNPLLNNQQFAGDALTVMRNRETVVLDLPPSTDELWSSYPSSNRNMIRKAEKAGLTIESVDPATGLGDFLAVYRATMERLHAEEYYLFSDAYFDALTSGLTEPLLLLARHEDKVVGGAFFLRHGNKLHYHLSGIEITRGLPTTNALLHEAARWGVEHGFTRLHLGGGRTTAGDDSLLRFKSRISGQRAAFNIGTRVHMPTVYQQLCDDWRSRQPADQKAPAIFLLYRQP